MQQTKKRNYAASKEKKICREQDKRIILRAMKTNYAVNKEKKASEEKNYAASKIKELYNE